MSEQENIEKIKETVTSTFIKISEVLEILQDVRQNLIDAQNKIMVDRLKEINHEGT